MIKNFFCLLVGCCLLLPCLVYADEKEPYFKLKSMKSMQMQNINRQTLDYSCGPASLAILLTDYFEDEYGEFSLLADIIQRLAPSEIQPRISKGFSMLDLKLLLHRLGYSAEGVLLPISAVSNLEGPIIILINKGPDLNHFVVLKGAKQGRAFIADPFQGHMRIPIYELSKHWNGEALIVGRKGFGLPKKHRLSLPDAYGVAPERDAIRALQHTPLKQRRIM